MTIFGFNDTSFSSAAQANDYCWHNLTYTWGAFSFACPGAGNQDLNSLEAYVVSAGGTPGNIRLAIYDASDNLIAEGSAQISVPSTSPGWVGHTSFLDSGGSPASITLTGGTNYRIAFSGDAADVRIYYESGSGGDQNFIDPGDYTGGFPDPLSGGSSQAFRAYYRADATPQSGGLTLPVARRRGR